MYRLRGDDGAIALEVGLSAPILLTLVLGLFDFAVYLLRQGTMASAANDGARKAVLAVSGADVGAQTACSSGGNANYTTICNAVRSRTAGAPVQSVQVICYTANTTTVRTCTSARSDTDSAEVIVTWGFRPFSPVGQTFVGNVTKTSKSRTVIQ